MGTELHRAIQQVKPLIALRNSGPVAFAAEAVTLRNMALSAEDMRHNKEVGERLAFARKRARFKDAIDFSSAHNIPQSTYHMRESGERTVKPPVARNYAALLGVNAAWLLTGYGPISSPVRSNEPPIEVEWLEIEGLVAAGVWRESVEIPLGERRSVPVPKPDQRFAGYRHYCIQVEGTSMNQRFPEGTALVCVDMIEWGRDPVNSDYVIVHRRSPEGFIEATVKQLRKRATDGTWWLWPESDDPDFQVPWRLPPPSEGDDNDDVRIAGLVIGYYVGLASL